MKTLSLMDWRGTLSTLPDPVAVIKALQAAGHYVVMHSNSSHDIAANAAFQACDDCLSKLTATVEKALLVKQAMKEHGLEAVVMVDDDRGDILPTLFKFHGLDMAKITIEELELPAHVWKAQVEST